MTPELVLLLLLLLLAAQCRLSLLRLHHLCWPLRVRTPELVLLVPLLLKKKLSYLEELDSSNIDDDLPANNQERRIFELSSLQKALSSAVCCSSYHAGNVELKEDWTAKQGLYMAPYLYCSNCHKTTPITFSVCQPSKTLAINRCSVLANKCVGGTHSDLAMFFAMLDLPSPVARCTYSQYIKEILGGCASDAQESMRRARKEVSWCFK